MAVTWLPSGEQPLAPPDRQYVKGTVADLQVINFRMDPCRNTCIDLCDAIIAYLYQIQKADIVKLLMY